MGAVRTAKKSKPKTARKITVELPSDLLDKATGATGLGLTPTIRKGLELIAAGEFYDKIRSFRGKAKFPFDIKTLREDRS
jgi:hypothetical protein